MINNICILIPTRKRLNDFKLFADSWIKTTEGKSVVIVGIDYDDNTYDELIEQKKYPFIYERQECKPFLKILNNMAVRYSEQFSCIAFLEDDATFNTNGWETLILEKQNEIGKNSIIWCNDLINREKMVGIPFMNANIIKILGWMSQPNFNTQWTDYYWKDLGQGLNSLYYFNDIIIEHRHFTTGKRNKDEISDKVQRESTGEGNYYRSQEYRNDLSFDINKLK